MPITESKLLADLYGDVRTNLPVGKLIITNDAASNPKEAIPLKNGEPITGLHVDQFDVFGDSRNSKLVKRNDITDDIEFKEEENSNLKLVKDISFDSYLGILTFIKNNGDRLDISGFLVQSDFGEGPPGEKGDTGRRGFDGDDGFIGTEGPVGCGGTKGDNGQDGKNGSDGYTGAMGPIGAEGPVGAKGPKGEKGEVGKVGFQGCPGDKGCPNGLVPLIDPGTVCIKTEVSVQIPVVCEPVEEELVYNTVENNQIVSNTKTVIRYKDTAGNYCNTQPTQELDYTEHIPTYSDGAINGYTESHIFKQQLVGGYETVTTSEEECQPLISEPYDPAGVPGPPGPPGAGMTMTAIISNTDPGSGCVLWGQPET